MNRLLSAALTAAFLLWGALSPSFGATKLVPLSRPGVWNGVSGIIGFRGKIWFINSKKFVNHNSADLYTYDPATGSTRYERALFSQDAGDPVVMGGLLYWPFEDPRFRPGAESSWHPMAASGPGALFPTAERFTSTP